MGTTAAIIAIQRSDPKICPKNSSKRQFIMFCLQFRASLGKSQLLNGGEFGKSKEQKSYLSRLGKLTYCKYDGMRKRVTTSTTSGDPHGTNVGVGERLCRLLCRQTSTTDRPPSEHTLLLDLFRDRPWVYSLAEGVTANAIHATNIPPFILMHTSKKEISI